MAQLYNWIVHNSVRLNQRINVHSSLRVNPRINAYNSRLKDIKNTFQHLSMLMLLQAIQFAHKLVMEMTL